MPLWSTLHCGSIRTGLAAARRTTLNGRARRDRRQRLRLAEPLAYVNVFIFGCQAMSVRCELSGVLIHLLVLAQAFLDLNMRTVAQSKLDLSSLRRAAVGNVAKVLAADFDNRLLGHGEDAG